MYRKALWLREWLGRICIPVLKNAETVYAFSCFVRQVNFLLCDEQYSAWATLQLRMEWKPTLILVVTVLVTPLHWKNNVHSTTLLSIRLSQLKMTYDTHSNISYKGKLHDQRSTDTRHVEGKSQARLHFRKRGLDASTLYTSFGLKNYITSLRFQPIPVAARSKGAAARLLGMRVLISPGSWMSLLWILFVVWQRSLRRADPSSREVLPTETERERGRESVCVIECDQVQK